MSTQAKSLCCKMKQVKRKVREEEEEDASSPRKRSRVQELRTDDGETPTSSTLSSNNHSSENGIISFMSSCLFPFKFVTERMSNMFSMRRAVIKDRLQQKCKRMKTTCGSWCAKFKAEFDKFKNRSPPKYREQGWIGRGGYGSVYAGYRVADNLPVAIKHVSKEYMFKMTNEDGTTIPTEVAVLSKLTHHPAVETRAPVALLDWYDVDNEVHIVMERPTPAKDLDRIKAEKGPIVEEDAKVIMKQLVRAAKELEDNNVVHRDLKLTNILLETGSDVPRVRLIDFGLSCFVKDASSYCKLYCICRHKPPEAYSSTKGRAGPFTTWQIGVVLYELLHTSMFNSIAYLRGKLEICSLLSEDCQDFMYRCLNPDPTLRPSLEELDCHPWFS